MSTQIVSVDAGNGGVNAILDKGNGKTKSVYFPSVRAAASGESLGLGKDFELEYDYVDWNGHRYVYGDSVATITRRAIERHQGINRYGNELHNFLIAVAIAKLGIKSGDVDLTVFAPPGLFTEAQTTLQERLQEHNGEIEIRFKGDKKARQWRYTNITVWPEGIGAAACFALDENGNFVQSDALSGEVVILDSGVYTLDALQMTDGNFNPESLQHATWENAGLDQHVRQPIVAALRKKSDDFTLLTVDDVDRVIRAGLTEGDFTLRSGGQSVDLKAVIEKHSERYAEWIANNIIDSLLNGLRGVKSMILVGGGATLIESHLAKWYDEKITTLKSHPATRKIHPTEANAVGGIRLARMRLKV